MRILEETSTITAKGQTTVPKSVRHVLGLGLGGKVSFRVKGQHVTLHAVDTQHHDPVIGRFLDFIIQDIRRRPEALTALSGSFASRMAALTKRQRVDTKAPIVGPVDL